MALSPELAARIMKKGSKTFHFASVFFRREQLEGAQLLYTFCRICDDAVDNAGSASEALDNVAALKHVIDESFSLTEATTEWLNSVHPDILLAREAWLAIEKRFQVPRAYANELILGIEMDAEGFSPTTTEDLLLYCYRVAGVVGLMMCHIMGLKDSTALQAAVDTGSSMQLTNIARDLREDFNRGRSYVPDAWQIPNVKNHFSVTWAISSARSLVSAAEVLFQSGRTGLLKLPFRARLAVAIAQVIYREIGIEVLRRGERGVLERTIVSFGRKADLAINEIIRLCAIEAYQFIRIGFDWIRSRVFNVQTIAPSVSSQIAEDFNLPMGYSPKLLRSQSVLLGQVIKSRPKNGRTEDTPSMTH